MNDMGSRRIDIAAQLSRMGDDLWYQAVQIRRRRGAELRGAWSEFGPVQPLGRAVRDALKLLETESVTIQFVHSSTEVTKINEIDILYLAQRSDYPFRAIAG